MRPTPDEFSSVDRSVGLDGGDRVQVRQAGLYVLARADDDALSLGDRLAVADGLGTQNVVVRLAARQGRRCEYALRSGRLHRHVVDVERRISRQLDGKRRLARPASRRVLLHLLVALVVAALLLLRLRARLNDCGGIVRRVAAPTIAV